MSPHRKPLLTIGLVCVLLMLPVVGVLQFRWLNQISDSRADRLHQTLETAGKQVRAELFDEISVISSLFTIDLDSDLEAGMASFSTFYALWRERTRFPGLIASIHLYRKVDQELATYVFDDQRQAFLRLETPYPPSVARTAGRIDQYLDGEQPIPIDSTELVITPIGSAPNEEPERPDHGWTPAGFLATEIDQEYLAQEMLPTLVADHVPVTTTGGEFHVAIVNDRTESVIYASDAVSYHDLSGDARRHVDSDLVLSYSVSMDPGPHVPPDPPATIRLSRPIIHSWIARVASGGPGGRLFLTDEAVTIVSSADASDLRSGGTRRIEFTPALRLLAWHQVGSIEQGVRQTRNRNLGVLIGVLLLLSSSILGLYFLLRRSIRLRAQEHEFIASVTHELRTPLAAIHATSENLAQGVISRDERVVRYGQMLLDEGVRLRTMVEQVLLFSGMSETRRTLHTEPIDIRELVERMVVRVPEIASQRLRIEVDERLEPFPGDRIAIESLVGNLLSNAFKHTESDTIVTISATAGSDGQGRKLLLRISDNGRGIPRRELHRVTEPFFRGRWSSEQQVPGSGLGLSLSSRIAASHGGSLTVASRAGGGTVVTVELSYDRRNGWR